MDVDHQCDMCVDNDGVFKSQALRHVGMIDLRLPALITLVKGWAKAHDINDPTNRTINSFALTLLVVHHLQQCLPAVLPPLAEILCPDPEVQPSPLIPPTSHRQ
jgi:DNA polymerase sigma